MYICVKRAYEGALFFNFLNFSSDDISASVQVRKLSRASQGLSGEESTC